MKSLELVFGTHVTSNFQAGCGSWPRAIAIVTLEIWVRRIERASGSLPPAGRYASTMLATLPRPLARSTRDRFKRKRQSKK